MTRKGLLRRASVVSKSVRRATAPPAPCPAKRPVGRPRKEPLTVIACRSAVRVAEAFKRKCEEKSKPFAVLTPSAQMNALVVRWLREEGVSV